MSTDEILEPHSNPADLTSMNTTANTIEAALRQLHELPTPVTSWLVETGTDSTDDPAIWVWAMLKEDVVDFAKRSRLRTMVRDRVRDLVQSEGEHPTLVYVRFRGASEFVQQD